MDEYVGRTSLYAQHTSLRASTLYVQAEYALRTQSGGISKLGFRFGPCFGLRRLGVGWALLFWEFWAINITRPWAKYHKKELGHKRALKGYSILGLFDFGFGS